MEDTRKLIRLLYQITAKLKEIHPHRNFTPDGILVGSLGEVLAEFHYAYRLCVQAKKHMIAQLMVAWFRSRQLKASRSK